MNTFSTTFDEIRNQVQPEETLLPLKSNSQMLADAITFSETCSYHLPTEQTKFSSILKIKLYLQLL